MSIDEKAFEAFMLAYHEHGGTGLGFRKCLAAYEAAKASEPDEVLRDALDWVGMHKAPEQPDELTVAKLGKVLHDAACLHQPERYMSDGRYYRSLARAAIDFLGVQERESVERPTEKREAGIFTPRRTKDSHPKDRKRMFISPEDLAKIKRGCDWTATVTDLNTGEVHTVAGCACEQPNCYCDAYIVSTQRPPKINEIEDEASNGNS